jgi:hypothetical protein
MNARRKAGRRAPWLVYLFLVALVPHRINAATPPRGIAIIRSEGAKIDERFIPAPPDQVKAALVKALPAVAAKVVKDDKEFHIEAKPDKQLFLILYRKNKDAGVRGLTAGIGALGTFDVDIRKDSREGITGSVLRIELHRRLFARASPGLAQPLAEETSCLVELLSGNDVDAHPRGLEAVNSGPTQALTLVEGTPLKLLLRDPLYSKRLKQGAIGQRVQFEVAADIEVDRVAVVRRGALGNGHFTEVNRAKGFGRHAEVTFIFDTVTAVDGQEISIIGAGERAKGGRKDDTLSTALGLQFLGGLVKGNEVLIRAGTMYDLEISGTHTIEVGR